MKNSNLTKKIRIISGKWKGYRIPVLNINGLRPTTDYMRETIFNWLSPYIDQAECLDCFAGSGILALEALSRSALNATLLEINYIIIKQLKEISKKLFIKNNKILHTNTLSWLKKNTKKYNLVFIDPPFSKKNLLLKTIQLIEKNKILKENSFIYIENSLKNGSFLIPQSWKLYRKKIIRSNIYQLFYSK